MLSKINKLVLFNLINFYFVFRIAFYIKLATLATLSTGGGGLQRRRILPKEEINSANFFSLILLLLLHAATK
jgi:hypothetical protein